MGVVTTAHLEQWANRVDARHMSGELMRRLIHANLPMSSISMIRFLANEATQLSGWDGVLSCSSQSPWVPDGNSVWELGVGANDRAKVKSDFNKRKDVELPDGWVRNETTYVAVSFRKFNNNVDFEAELKDLADWKNVVIIDSSTMEEWIENFYSVQAWLNDEHVIPYISIESLAGFWQRWVEKTDPEITEALLLHARDEQGKQFLEQFSEEDAYFTVQSDSPEESLAFSYAVISANPEEEEKLNYLSKCVVVNSVEDARKISTQEQHNIFLVNNAISEVRSLAKYGHRVIVANGRRVPKKTPAEVELKRLLGRDFSEALQKIGLSKEDAEKDSRACGASVGIWRVWNQLEFGISDDELPNWANNDYAETVIPAVLIGGWDESCAGDISIIQKLAGCDYPEYCLKLQQFLNHDNPLMVKIGDSWVVTASATAFALVVQNINKYHLQRFEEAVNDVFSEVDPRLEMPSEERGMAAVHGVTVKHTNWIRDGLAETLLKISVLGSRLEDNSVFETGVDKQTYVNRIIAGFNAISEDVRVIASLSNQMPVLAEAAPVPFMEALDSLIQGDPDSIKAIFSDGDGIYGHSYHSHFLWSLELLAWEPTFFPRTCLILLNLAALDPGGQTSNRPINSLKEIFLSWSPGTVAALNTRLEVLQLLARKNEEVVWELMEGLFPQFHGISHPTSEPKWKDFSRSEKAVLTHSDRYNADTGYLKFAILIAGVVPKRWLSLIGVYSMAPDDLRLEVLEGLRFLDGMLDDKEERHIIWTALRQECSKHKKFPDAKWSMAEDEINELESLLPLFEGTEVAQKANWLFNEYYPDIGFPKADFRSVDKELYKMRKRIISEILDTGGKQGLIALVDEVQHPIFVARSIDETILDFNFFDECSAFYNSNNNANSIFFSSLSQIMLKLFGCEWNTYLLSCHFFQNLDNAEKAKLFVSYPDNFDTYELVSTVGAEVEGEYWKIRSVWFSDNSPEILNFVTGKLIEYGRSIELPMKVGFMLDKFPEDFGFKLLDDIYNRLGEEGVVQALSGQSNGIIEVFENLNRANTDFDRLAQLEYKYLPLLNRYFSMSENQLTLHKMLSKDAAFFMKIMVQLYKAASSEKQDESTEESKHKAQMAWNLMYSWKTPPGLSDDGSVNIEQFDDWVVAARKLAEEADRVVICDQKIGEVLYFLPEDDEDGNWPHRCLRQLLEDIDSKEIETGLGLAQFNSRGVTCKAMYEGGKQERELAAMWTERAEKLSTTWPKSSAFCSRISGRWEREAVAEDERAEQDKLRYR
jgi:hypothetical protein